VGDDGCIRLRALSVATLVIHGEEDALPVAVSADVFFPIVDSFLAAPLSGGVRQSL